MRHSKTRERRAGVGKDGKSLLVYACPKCGNTEGLRQERIRGMGTGDHVCPKCGFVGPPPDWKTTEAKFGWVVPESERPPTTTTN